MEPNFIADNQAVLVPAISALVVAIADHFIMKSGAKSNSVFQLVANILGAIFGGTRRKFVVAFALLFLLSSCAGMTPKAKVRTAGILVSTSIEIAYANAEAICETLEEKPPECEQLAEIKADVDAITECVSTTIEKVMDLTEKIKE